MEGNEGEVTQVEPKKKETRRVGRKNMLGRNQHKRFGLN
jgi:hypothetical protein